MLRLNVSKFIGVSGSMMKGNCDYSFRPSRCAQWTKIVKESGVKFE
jgi:hypothetical protein